MPASNYQAILEFQPEWVLVEGVKVLRVKENKFVAVPHTNRKNSRLFDIINLEDRKGVVCCLTSKEVRSWLVKTSKECAALDWME